MEQMKKRFFAYVDRFYSENDAHNRAIRLKRDHTRRVCRNAQMLANKLYLSDTDGRLIEIMALFHDIGRFKQYWVYKTFRDVDSENHARLSVSEIKAYSLLTGLAETDRTLVCQAIEFHNAFAIPDHLSSRLQFFLRLLRDADKLDIWKVFGEYCEDPQRSATDSVALGLPDTAQYSQGALNAVCAGRLVRTGDLKTLNDFKLLQVSWVYDINFVPTMAAMLDKGYMDRLRTYLPDTREIHEAFEMVFGYAAAVVEAGAAAKIGRKNR